MDKKSGIYQIRNLVNDKRYIGQSINLHKRKSDHFSSLKNDKHANYHLQNSYNKHGKQNFIFETLLYCEPFQLTDYEQFFVDRYKDLGLLYNSRLECVDSNRGVIFSEEARKNMLGSRKNMSGKNHPIYGKNGKDSPRIIEESIVLEVLRLLGGDMKAKDIAEQVNVSQGTVYKAKNGYYSDIYGLNEEGENDGIKETAREK